MEKRRLGSSDLHVSVLAFGAWQIGDPAYWGPSDQADARAAVDAALDSGINCFDTAEMYGKGESERVLGQCLKNRRDEAVVASKFIPEHAEPARLRQALEDSLRRLDMDYLDLYQVHWPIRDASLEDAAAMLEELRCAGKVRYAGVSNFGPLDLQDWFEAGGAAVSNQLGYNLLFRAVEYDILPACAHHGLGVLVYMPLLQGILADRWQSPDAVPEKRRRTRHFSADRSSVRHGQPGFEALAFQTLDAIRAIAQRLGAPMADLAIAWLLRQPGVASVIVGGRKPHQIQRNARAAQLRLDQSTRAELDAATAPLKNALGPNADLWMAGTNSRIR